MISEYIFKKLGQAKYGILDDGNYFGKIPGLKGVWASSKTLEDCRQELREVLEEWIVLKLKDGDKIPGFSIKTGSNLKMVIPAHA